MTPTPIIGKPSSAEVTTPETFTEVWAFTETIPASMPMTVRIKNLKLFMYYLLGFYIKRAKIIDYIY
jgi:hypothetical protein